MVIQRLSENWTDFSNNSNNRNFCAQYLNLRDDTKLESSLKITAYTVALVLALIGNTLVICILLRKNHLSTTTNMFIMNMAASDLMMAIVCMPTTIYYIANNNNGQMFIGGSLGSALCKLLAFLQGLAITVSVFIRLVLAVDRYLAIVYPFHLYISTNRAKLLVVSAWISGTLVNAPLLYAMKLDNGDVCIESWDPYFDDDAASKDYTIALFVVTYAMPLLLITFLYTALLKELWRSVYSNRTAAFQENKAVLKMLVTVIILFAVCWLPIHVTSFFVMYTNDLSIKKCGVYPVVYFIGWFMAHSNSSINPIIYFRFNERFQHEFSRWLKSTKGFFKRRQEPSHSASFVKPRIIVTQFTTNQTVSAGISNNSFDDENGTVTINL